MFIDIRVPHQGKTKTMILVRKDHIPLWIRQQGLNWFYLDKEDLQTNFGKLSVSKRDYALMQQQANLGDVFEMTDTGSLSRVFSNDSSDNLLYITGHCNSNCIMCPASDHERMQSEDEEEELLLSRLLYLSPDMEHLTITGGEPFLRYNLTLEILKWITDNRPSLNVLLLTNGRAFSVPAIMKSLSDNHPLSLLVGIPLHSDNSKVHDEITRSNGSFDQTCKGITNLLSCGINVEIRIVVNRINCHSMLPMAHFITKCFSSIAHVTFMGMEMTGNAAKNKQQLWMPYHNVFSSIHPAIDYLIANGIDVLIYNLPLCAVPQNYHFLLKQSISPYKIRFGKVCTACNMQKICGGVFGSSLALAEQDFQPYEKSFLF